MKLNGIDGKAVLRRPLRLAVDFHVWDGIFQGSRSHLLGLYAATIPKAGDIEFVFFLDDVSGLVREHPVFASENVRCVSMPHRNGLIRLGWQLPRLRQAVHADLMHVQYRLPFWGAHNNFCTIHDVLYETHPQFFSAGFVAQSRVTGRRAARRAVQVLTVSNYSRAEIARIYGLAPSDVVVTCNGVDGTRFYPGEAGAETVLGLGLEPGRYLLTVGRLEPRKNHVALVRAYALLVDPPPLVMVGQRDFGFDDVFRSIESLGLSDRVHVLQGVTDAQLPALMRHAMVFVYPAVAEGFGMPVVEAAASGVAVVTSNSTSLPEVAGEGALKVDPHDFRALAQAMATLIADPAQRLALAIAGVEHARRFSWGQSADALLNAVRRWQSQQSPKLMK